MRDEIHKTLTVDLPTKDATDRFVEHIKSNFPGIRQTSSDDENATRFVWQINSDLGSIVEVRFSDTDKGTRIDLTHRLIPELKEQKTPQTTMLAA